MNCILMGNSIRNRRRHLIQVTVISTAEMMIVLNVTCLLNWKIQTTRDLWQKGSHHFCENLNNNDGGFKIFPFHFLVYLYHYDNRRQHGDLQRAMNILSNGPEKCSELFIMTF